MTENIERMSIANGLDVVKFLFHRHLGVKNKYTFSQVLSMFDSFSDNVIIVVEKGQVKGVAVYLGLNDLALRRLLSSVYKLSNPEDFRKLMSSPGDNIHFFFICADGVNIIKRGLSFVIKKKNPKTVSWFEPNNITYKLYNTGGIECLK